MATYPPSKGQIWKRNGQYYRILGINSSTNDVLIEKIDEKGNKTSVSSKPISKNDWIKRDYELVESFDSHKEEPKDNSKDNHQKEPVFSFVYNPETQKFSILKNGEFVTDLSLYTVAGANGMSAYEQWVNRLPQGTKEEDKSFDKFLNVLKGVDGKDAAEWTINEEGYWCCNGIPTSSIAVPKRGENGKSAYEIWAESQPLEKRSREDYEDFIKGKDGKPGQSAFEAWKNLNPAQRQNATLSDFFNWLVDQTEKKIDAKEGATWIPNIIDGKLVYVNNRSGAATDEYPVKGKDGKSYYPNFIDGKLVFIDENGHEITPRHEYRGKSAFEVWKDLPGNSDKNEKDFFEYLKGEKGDPGLDGINVDAKHSYLEIKDWTCPVQTIDTELITNISNSSKSPDAIIEERMKEIEDKRREGNELLNNHKEKTYYFVNGNWWYKNWGGWFKEFSWWCAGADRPLLRMCPSDHSKYTGIGTVILFTALMAWFSSYIAMRLVFDLDNKEGLALNIAAIGFATFWSLMIFFLDRFITNTMYSDGEVTISKKEFIGGLPRILIAIFLGIVISAPLELKIFQGRIDMEMRNQKRTERYVEEQKAKDKANADFQLKMENLNKKIQSYQTQLNGAKDAETALRATRPEDNNQIWNNSSTDPNGVTTTKSGTTNINANSQKKWDSDNAQILKDYQAKQQEALDSIRSLNLSISVLEAKRDTFVSKEVADILDQFENDFDEGLTRQLHTLHQIAMEGYVPWFYDEKPNQETNRNVSDIASSSSISNKYGAENNKFAAFADTILHAWWWYLFNSAIGLIMLLFILIDISPVLYKMMLADGIYDKYLQQEKLLKQDKIRLSLARMLRKIDKGELKALSPFIMGKIYRKLSKYSVSGEGTPSNVFKDYKTSINWGKNVDELNETVEKENKKVFETVLEYKRRIILASYAAWYRDMKDALIGSASEDPGSDEISPENHIFDDPNFENHNTSSEDEEVNNNFEQEENNTTSTSEDASEDDSTTENSAEEETSEDENNNGSEVDPDVEEISDTQNEDDEKPNSDWDDDDVERKL